MVAPAVVEAVAVEAVEVAVLVGVEVVAALPFGNALLGPLVLCKGSKPGNALIPDATAGQGWKHSLANAVNPGLAGNGANARIVSKAEYALTNMPAEQLSLGQLHSSLALLDLSTESSKYFSHRNSSLPFLPRRQTAYGKSYGKIMV